MEDFIRGLAMFFCISLGIKAGLVFSENTLIGAYLGGFAGIAAGHLLSKKEI